ncbi:UNVERIFIED_CONTAM: Nucleobase-ascorbate transporter 7 [Sesamum radiatum]|uniref:Nucleobase-ascorbate transporter 7 n=1 Tax=Sesamum radiatum TaxID=300843 RepID=A0AAW2MZC5_SESRA
MAGGGAAAPPPKQEELVPHPVKDQLAGVSYCITSPPPWPEAILLGFQHFLVMLGTTVLIPSYLVPQMGGGKEEKALMIQTLQFVAGLNTLAQTLFGTRLPAVIGGSYTFVPTTLSIVLAGRYSGILDPEEKFRRTMRGIQGAMIVASTLQVLEPPFYGSFGSSHRIWALTKCVEIGLPQLIILVIFSQYLPHVMKGGRNVFDRFAVLFSVVIVWIYAHLLTVGGAYRNVPQTTQVSCRTDRAGIISAAPWIRVPYPFQWGAPTFNAGESFAMMATSFVALVESTGAFIAVSRYASATPLPHSVLSRGVGWQGVGILFSGIFGTGNGSSVSIENAGLLGLTRVGSRRVIQISAGFMIFFSILGKFGAVFASIPAPIIAALYCLLFAYVGAGGLGFLQFCNLNSFRTKFILAFSIFMGLSIPQYFNEYLSVKGYGPVHTNARWFNDMINVPFSSEPFVAGVLALVLDVTLPPKDNTTRKDRGMHWWDKFRSYKTDTRSEEFYSLPLNLNKFFPSV